MNILGLDEAFATAEARKIEEVKFKVINISAFLVLKLFAWNDRKAKKDLEDIYFILEKYNDDERVFSELIDELSQEVIQYSEAPAFLLGRDIKNTFSQIVINEFTKIIENLLDRKDSLFPQLVPSNFDSDEWDDKFNTVVAKFEALQQGIF